MIYQITNDHSLIEEQVKAGALSREEAQQSQAKNVITRCVGYRESEFVDCGSLLIEKGDRFVLCSDGLHGQIAENEIVSAVLRKPTFAAESLIKSANQAGGKDNTSVIIVTVD